ncbi:sigma-54-dependent Fis family transcriptional regulator [Streptomyces klenkii]
MEAARSSLDHLCSYLDSTDVSVVVADAHACIRDRRDLSPSAGRLLDELCVRPGCSCAEKTLGTNAVGTALETGYACRVIGAEHVAEQFHQLACVGAPVRDWATNTLEGVVALACRTNDYHPLMLALARQAADSISRCVHELAHRAEFEAFHEFLDAPSRRRQPLVLLTDDLVAANKSAVRLFGDPHHRWLRQLAALSRTPGEGVDSQIQEIELPSHRLVRVRSSLLEKNGEIQGQLVEFLSRQHRTAKQPRTGLLVPLPGLAGDSEHWLEAGTRLVAARRNATWTLVTGEPGVGKLALVRAAHRYAAGRYRFHVLDAAAASHRPEAWLAAAAEVIRRGTTTVVLAHLQLATPSFAVEINSLLARLREDERTGNTWVVGLVTLPVLPGWDTTAPAQPPAGGEHEVAERFGSSFPQTLELLPLRYRRQDVRALVPVLLNRYLRRSEPACRPDTMKALVNAPWPGNVVQLEHCLQAAAGRCHGDVLLPRHLPQDLGIDRSRVLSPWETAERDAIVRALRASHGDRAEAARFLGISRATVYRKIRGYGIDVPLNSLREDGTSGLPGWHVKGLS